MKIWVAKRKFALKLLHATIKGEALIDQGLVSASWRWES